MRGLWQSLPQSSFLLELLMRSEFRDGDLKHSHIQPRENQNLQDRRIEVKWNCWKLEGLCKPWWASGVDTSNCFWTTLSLLKWLLCAFLFPMSPLSPLHIVCISSEQRQKVLHKGTNACCVNMLHDVFRTPRFMVGESNWMLRPLGHLFRWPKYHGQFGWNYCYVSYSFSMLPLWGCVLAIWISIFTTLVFLAVSYHPFLTSHTHISTKNIFDFFPL